jgi:hypothetical protein
MDEADEEQARIDPRLIEHFSLFREPGPGPGGPLDAQEVERVEQLREMVRSGRIPPLTARGLVFDQVRKVALSATRVMLAIPGQTGMQVVVRNSEHGLSYGSGTKIAGRIEGLPILSIGPNLIGLAVDGVERQPVEFRDGSIGYASVRNNTYCIEDPNWTPDPSARPVGRF